MDKAALYDFVKSYLNDVAWLAEHESVVSDFADGYQKGLLGLKDILDNMEKSKENNSSAD